MAYGYGGGGRGAGRDHYDRALNGYDQNSFTRHDSTYDNFASRRNLHEPRFVNYSGWFQFLFF